MTQKGVQVITATVPPSGSIEMRAEELVKDIDEGAQGKAVNIIAHSMVRYSFTYLSRRNIHGRLTGVRYTVIR